MVTEQGNFNSQNVWLFGYHLIPTGKKLEKTKCPFQGNIPFGGVTKMFWPPKIRKIWSNLTHVVFLNLVLTCSNRLLDTLPKRQILHHLTHYFDRLQPSDLEHVNRFPAVLPNGREKMMEQFIRKEYIIYIYILKILTLKKNMGLL